MTRVKQINKQCTDQEGISINRVDVNDPVAWDRWLNTIENPGDHLAEFAPSSELLARRHLALAAATRCPEAITRALDEVETRFPAIVCGAKLLALGQSGHPEAVHAAPQGYGGISALELEDACDVALARGMAARALGELETASAHLNVALFLARTLQMQHREQLLMLELGQILTAQGKPAPDFINQALALPIAMSERRRWYGAQILAEACLAVGDYARARQLVAGHAPQAETALWAFLSALLGDESARSVTSEEGSFTTLAGAIWALREGREIEVPPVAPHSPESEYASLIRGLAMLRKRAMSPQARRALEGLRNLTPEQRVWQLAGLVHAAALGEGARHAGRLMIEFREALDALRTKEYILPLLQQLMPEAYMLLGFLPHAHPEVADTITALPLLTGEGVTHRYVTTKLPGKTEGSCQWVRAAAMGRSFKLHPQARARLDEALKKLGHQFTPNLGFALRVIHNLRATAPQSDAAIWDRALHQALAWVDNDCLRGELECALK